MNINQQPNQAERKAFITLTKSSSARINSACIRNTQTKYLLPRATINTFKSSKMSQNVSQILKDISPVYRFTEQKDNLVSTMQTINQKAERFKERQSEKSKIVPKRVEEYVKFSKIKSTFLKESKLNLDDYLQNDKHFSRRFYKNYYQRDKHFFKPTQINQVEIPVDKNPQNAILRNIISLERQARIEEEQKQRRIKVVFEEKKEEQKDRDLKKQALDRFIDNQQNYFEKLNKLGGTSFNQFRTNLLMKDTYHFDNIVIPEKQFTSYKDMKFTREDIFNLSSNDVRSPKTNVFTRAVSCVQELEIEIEDKIQLVSQQQSMGISQLLLNQNTVEQVKLSRFDNGIEFDVVKQFWQDVKTNEKEIVTFAILIDPRLLYIHDLNGMSPLHWACLRSYNSLAKHFITKQLSYDVKDNFGRSPKDIAVLMKNVKILEFIKHLDIQKAHNYSSKMKATQLVPFVEVEDF